MANMGEKEVAKLESEAQAKRDALSMLVTEEQEEVATTAKPDSRFDGILKKKEFAQDPTHKDF